MRKFIIKIIPSILFVLFLSVNVEGADPLLYGYDSANSGDDADTSNNQVTIPFSAHSLVICNDDDADNIYADFSDGVATTTNDSTNVVIKPSECKSYTLGGRNATDTIIVGLITSSGAAHFRIDAVREQ